MNRWEGKADIATIIMLLVLAVLGTVFWGYLLMGCTYESDATGWSQDAGLDVHRGEYRTPPAAREEHSHGRNR